MLAWLNMGIIPPHLIAVPNRLQPEGEWSFELLIHVERQFNISREPLSPSSGGLGCKDILVGEAL
jgi:hypothetical protein